MAGGLSYKGRKGVPRPKRDHEAEPREKEDAAVDIDGVQGRDRPGLAGDRVDLRGGIQVRELERHGWLTCCSVDGNVERSS